MAAVYDLTSNLLASIALGMLGNRTAAEDVVQDVFVRLAQHAGNLHGDDGRAVRAWLVRTVRNRCLDVRKSATSRLERAAADVVEDRATAPGADTFLETDLSPELAAALERLTEDQRTALVLSHVAGMSGNEVGAVLGRNRAAVYTLLRRAERAMRTHLAEGVRPGTPRSS